MVVPRYISIKSYFMRSLNFFSSVFSGSDVLSKNTSIGIYVESDFGTTDKIIIYSIKVIPLK